MTIRRQSSGSPINSKHNHIIRALIRYEQESSSWINNKIARPVALRRNMLQMSKPAGSFIDSEDYDAVVASI